MRFIVELLIVTIALLLALFSAWRAYAQSVKVDFPPMAINKVRPGGFATQLAILRELRCAPGNYVARR